MKICMDVCVCVCVCVQMCINYLFCFHIYAYLIMVAFCHSDSGRVDGRSESGEIPCRV